MLSKYLEEYTEGYILDSSRTIEEVKIHFFTRIGLLFHWAKQKNIQIVACACACGNSWAWMKGNKMLGCICHTNIYEELE